MKLGRWLAGPFPGAHGPAGTATTILSAEKPVIPDARPLAFTLAPHLQIINYRDCFSPFVGI
ncbi:hypothetical protein KMZ29_05000 [Bradyrhizobium sediminis]|uniref:Uncharacterized protein n=1 Tax=Bradyrhizobium sediminis TaxID=2840469 RepID=A0A975NFE0_9BRAD|nr:hypothetical protein [Bradyrhizobium sediminis]QWG14062.1 hypothetical protein KMZ29_05000 [Bradyrhizobium sediminis]